MKYLLAVRRSFDIYVDLYGWDLLLSTCLHVILLTNLISIYFYCTKTNLLLFYMQSISTKKLNEWFQSNTHYFVLIIPYMLLDIINITLYIKIHFLSHKNSTYFNAVDSIFCPFVCQGLIQIVLLAVGIFLNIEY